MSTLFVKSDVPDLYMFSNEAIRSLIYEWDACDEAQKVMILKTIMAGARFNGSETLLMAQVFLVLLTEGAESAELMVRAEAIAHGISV